MEGKATRMEVYVSLAQFNARIRHPEDNLAIASAWVAEAGRRGSDLVLLPELWLDGLDYARAAQLATGLSEGAFAHMRRLAREAHVYVAGSAFERNGPHVYNTLAVCSPAGEIAALYRKVHLFRPMEEDRHLQAGSELVVAELPWGRLGLTICYDLRFPELFRYYALQDVVAVLVPAQWPLARLAHWRVLTRARAIENHYFVLACNRAGDQEGARFGGHSVVCDPWGERVIEAGLEPVLLTTSIHLEAIVEARERMPVFWDRRPDLYG